MYANANYPPTPLRQVISRVQYGTSSLATEEPVGLPIIRMNNLQNDGWDFTNLKYIDLSEKEAEVYRLNPGDILFNRTNSKELVGKCEVFRESGYWVFASYLIRVSLDHSRAISDFVSAFLNTKSGRAQIDRVSRQIIGMSNVNAEELQDLLIPLPPLNIQRSLVSELEDARQSRKQKLAEADELLSSLDAYLLDQLELSPPKERKRRTLAVKLEKIKNGRFDPKFALSEKEISGKFKAVELGRLVTLEPEYGSGSRAVPMRTTEDIKYIRITDFNDDGIPLGHEFVSAEVIEDQYFLEHEDFLFARSGATAGKTFIYTRDIGSAIFAGYCIRFRFNENLVLPWFVYFYTKTSLYKSWVNSIQRPSGQPNINKEEFKSFRIALPPLDIQHTLVVEMQRIRKQAQQLRQEAEAEWEVAKTRFERKLLGEEG